MIIPDIGLPALSILPPSSYYRRPRANMLRSRPELILIHHLLPPMPTPNVALYDQRWGIDLSGLSGQSCSGQQAAYDKSSEVMKMHLSSDRLAIHIVCSIIFEADE